MPHIFPLNDTPFWAVHSTVDELLATANKVDEQPSLYSHGMLDNYGKNTWDYWQVFIQEPNGNVWIATLNIVNSMKNQKILYDINPLDMVEGAVKSATHSTNGIVDLEEDSVKQNSDRDSEGNTLTAEQMEFFKDAKTRDAQGRLKPYYHGTGRADRVGYHFRADRATSGSMAFFTDSKPIAENYAKDKQDTSLAYDEMYQD